MHLLKLMPSIIQNLTEFEKQLSKNDKSQKSKIILIFLISFLMCLCCCFANCEKICIVFVYLYTQFKKLLIYLKKMALIGYRNIFLVSRSKYINEHIDKTTDNYNFVVKDCDIVDILFEIDYNNNKCPICLEELYNTKNILIIKNCKHIFHIDCVYEWFNNNYKETKQINCPLCRKKIKFIDLNN